MASKGQITKTRRKLSKKNLGRKQRRSRNNKGTTPELLPLLDSKK